MYYMDAGFKKINDYLWEIPAKEEMRVPVRVYASEKILGRIEKEAINQAANVSSLPGIVGYSFAMPDIHSGYGFPIGGVAATEHPKGVISPGGIGFDENCGVRLLRSKHTFKEAEPYIEKVASDIQKEVPSGLGRGRRTKISLDQINKILNKGLEALQEEGYAGKDDVENCEEKGRMREASSSAVSEHAKNRGRDQLGTLGSGNHFCEIQKVEQIFDQETAEAFGVFKDQIVIMIHTGSRGLGHQNCKDYLRVAEKEMARNNISLPDKQLACMPFDSNPGQEFFRAMSAACNFAWANRQMISFYVRKVWKEVLGGPLDLLYDVAHNIAKIEEHEFLGKKMKLIVHRKGATRAFPAGHPDVPRKYNKTGQPVLIPGSMGTPSFILAGTENPGAWHTVCHGAGRTMSRREATRRFKGKELVGNLKERGVLVKSHSMKGISEEAPSAYKDIQDVVEVVHGAGLAKKVAQLTPLAVVKGE